MFKMEFGNIFRFCLVVAFAISVSLRYTAALTINYTQTVEFNTTVVLVCTFDVEYPSWSGPPIDAHGYPTLYNYGGSSNFNPYLDQDKLQRMSWANNKRDLVLNPVSRADEGDYKCDITGSYWKVKLYVRVRPYEPTTIAPGVFIENQPTNLTCLSIGGYPQQSVDWYRNTVSNETRLSGTITVDTNNETYNVTSTLTFTPTSADNGVLFICQSSYSDEPRLIEEAHTIIRFELAPSEPFITLLGPLVESEDTASIARCTSTGFWPADINMTWTMQGGPVEPALNSKVTDTGNSTFMVTSDYRRAVNRSLNGKTLTCSVSHVSLSSPKSGTAALTVLFAPRFTNITGDVSIYANDVNIIILTCQTDSSSPASKTAWYRDGQLVPNSATSNQTVGDNGGLVTSQLLEFVPTREMDGQVVECRATHPLSQETYVHSSVTLDLKYSPEVTFLSSVFVEMTAGWLNCSVSSKPESTITWYRIAPNMENISDGLVPGHNSLSIVFGAVSKNDEGTYRCTANNRLGVEVNSNIYLNVTTPSHVDMNEEVCCSLPQTIGSSVGTFAFGFVVAVVAMVTVVKLRQKHSGRPASTSSKEHAYENKVETDPGREYDTLEDVSESAAYEIPESVRQQTTSVL